MIQSEATAVSGDGAVGGAPTLQDFLRLVIDKGGTDLHLTAESPPVMRVNGDLTPLPFPPLSPNDTKQLCYSVITETQKHRFEEELELDFSFGVRGLSRFRSRRHGRRPIRGGAGDERLRLSRSPPPLSKHPVRAGAGGAWQHRQSG